MLTLDEMSGLLADHGWLKIDIPNPSAIFAARDRLVGYLRRSLPALERLDDYHKYVTDDARHEAILHDLATFYWEAALASPIITSNLSLFRQLIGLDLHMQTFPYLRSVRPGSTDDAAPLHRDTYYGASAFEVSILVPLTEMEETSSIRVISGSHLAPDSAYPYTQTVSKDVVIQSPKHQLGYPYAPRLLEPSLLEIATPVPLSVGQVLIFPLQLVHGGGSNTSQRTRFSTDIRLANSLAPVEWSRGVRKEYYESLIMSPVTRSALAYQMANAASPITGSE